MDRVERPDGARKWFEGAREDRALETEHCESADEEPHDLAQPCTHAPRMHESPDLVLEQPARGQRSGPQLRRRAPVLGAVI